MLSTLFSLFKIIRSRRNRSPRLYTTDSLIIFYKVAHVLECLALGDIIDFVSPFNVWMIPNNAITRYLLPNLAGKALSGKIFHLCGKFLFEDAP